MASDSDPAPDGESTTEAPSRSTPVPFGVRLADLEDRLAQLEDDLPGLGVHEAYPAASADAAAVEELRRAIVELEARVDANVARLQKVEAADAARLRRFDSEVRKISGAATAGLRQALEEAQAVGADEARLARTEAQINELAAQLEALKASVRL